MESDPTIMSTEKWYDMTRDEQIEHNFKKVKRIYEIKKEYFNNNEIDYITWYQLMF